jgi:hypothetical protein
MKIAFFFKRKIRHDGEKNIAHTAASLESISSSMSEEIIRLKKDIDKKKRDFEAKVLENVRRYELI